MAKSIEELREAITLLETKVDEDVTQTVAIVTAVNALIAKLEGTVITPDFQAEFDALVAITNKVVSDNPAVQTAIDAAGTKTA